MSEYLLSFHLSIPDTTFSFSHSYSVIHKHVITHLNEKGFLMKPKSSHPQVEQIASELDIHDTMIESLVEILEEKGHIKSDEVDRRTQKKMHRTIKKEN